MHFNLKKNKENYEVNVFHSAKSKSSYTNILTKDSNRIAQILLDLIIQGFPVEEAIEIVKKRIRKRDWIGL